MIKNWTVGTPGNEDIINLVGNRELGDSYITFLHLALELTVGETLIGLDWFLMFFKQYPTYLSSPSHWTSLSGSHVTG